MSRPDFIDLSEWNTVTDWDALKNSGINVILRIGYRNSKTGKITYDKDYKAKKRGCISKGIPFGYYFFTTATTPEEGVEEAEFVINELRGITEFICPVWCDSEFVDYQKHLGRSDRLSTTARTKAVKAFCDRLQKSGIPAGVYSYTSFLKNNLDMSKLPYSVWVASYRSKCDYDGDYILWQFTSSYPCPGVGTCDASVLHESGASEAKEYYAAQKVIDIALAEVGYMEKRNGDLTYLFDKTANAGSANYTKYGYEMHKLQPKNMDYPAAWCDCFVDWCFMKAYGTYNAKALIGGDFDDYTIISANLYKNAGRWQTKNPKPGDQIFFKNSTGTICHTGLVYKVSGDIVYTVEGNTSSEPGMIPNGGCVRTKQYNLNYGLIAGYGRPRYTAQTSDKTTAKVDTTGFPTIKKWSTKTDWNLLLQNALTLRGFPTAIDGVFGSDTEAKVKAFQRANVSPFTGKPLIVDGVVGKETWAALFA